LNYSIIEADLEKNRKAILELWRKNFPDLPPERYDWIYQENPYGKAWVWAARETDSDSLVGTTSLFARKMNVKGDSFKAGIAGDFAVNPKHRGSPVSIKLQRAVIGSMNENDLKFIYGISNRKAEPVQLRVGYVLLGKMDRWVKVLKTRRYFKSSVFYWLASKPLDFIMKGLSREVRYRRPKDYTVQKLKSFDERFDLLWQKASTQFNIIGERSKDYLNWRYGESPHQKYHIFSLVQKDEQEILGYIVHYLKDKVGVIADMLFLNYGSALESLLSEFILFLRSQDVESISVLLFGCPPLAKKLRSFGFFLREEESRILVYRDENSPHADFILNSSNWLLLEGDRDI
jgi:hypothetical protein